jgi:hypothetical protein
MNIKYNRRSFVKLTTLAVAGTGLSLTGLTMACSKPGADPIGISGKTFNLNVLDDGSFSLYDKIGKILYAPDPWEEGAGTISINRKEGNRRVSQTFDLSMADKIQREVNGQTIKISFIWNQGIDLLISLALLEDSLTIAIENLVLPDDTRLVNLVYPNRFASLKTGENGYLIVPARCGYIIPSHHYTRIGGEFWRMDDAYTQTNPNGITNTYLSAAFTFNFFGIQKGENGLTFICEDAFDASLRVFANTRGDRYSFKDGKWSMKDQIAGYSSVWDASLGKLNYARKLTIRRHGKDGYNESAAIYRKWLDDNGWTRTLAEKIKQNPDREKLIGSSHIDIYGGYPHYTPNAPKAVDFTFDQINNIVTSLSSELKLDRISIAVWGAFENYPPYHWPVNKRRGGFASWKKAIDNAKKAGYLISAYYSYFPLLEHDASFNPYLIRQIDPDNPDPVKRAKDNDRWSRTCSSLIIDFAKANNESKEYRDLGENAHFIDIMGVSSGYECYDKENHNHPEPITRKQDKDLRNKMFSYLHDELNLVTWQEHGSVTELKTMDSFHGTAETHVAFEEIGVQIPLAALVSHDLVVLTQHPGWNYRHARGQFYARVLQNILQGNPPIHCIQAWEFEGRKKDIASFHKVIARIHRQVGLAKLIDHQFLPGPAIYNTGTFLIQKTSFDDGSNIYANFGMNPYQSDDVNLGPYGFEARLGSGEVLKGSVISGLHII